MDGTEISARFGLPPNSKKYCGRREFAAVFAAYLKRKSYANLRALKTALSHFHAHYSYLKLIAAANGKKPFDRGVTEALWLGNGLLKNVKKKDLQKIILRDFCGKGMLSAARAEKMALALPDGFVPHHSFHVFHIHSITDVVPPTLSTSDNCRVSWGKVVGAKKGAVIVKTQKLAKKNGKLVLLPAVKRWKISCAGIALLPDAKEGDIVASHWGVAVMGISKRQAAELEKVTKQNIAAANKLGKH